MTVGGNFVITDRSYQGRPLAECTNEELLEEEQIRYRVLREEQFSKLKVVVISAAALVLTGAIYFWIKGFPEHFTFLIGIAGVLAALGGAQIMTARSDTAQVAELDLRTINTILRMRGVRR